MQNKIKKLSILVGVLALMVLVSGAQTASAALTLDATSITGTAAVTLAGVASSVYTIGAANTTGAITIGGTGQTTGVISLGDTASSTVSEISIGGGNGSKTAINIGDGTGVNGINIGTGATGVKTIKIGDGDAANVITIGSTTGGASLALKAGSGGVVVTGVLTATSPTFATSITGSYLTASELLGTDVSKNIVSLAVGTYPSLVELSYVKGLTSSAQTQISGLVPYIGATTGLDLGTNDLFVQSVSLPENGDFAWDINGVGKTLISLESKKKLIIGDGSLGGILDFMEITTIHKTFIFPNASGTLALGTGTINELSYWAGANTLGTLAVATYPSLTELSYVKGLSSAIQTQFTGKAATDQAMFIGTTEVAINRTSAALTLAGITLTTPAIGAATGASLVLTGAATIGTNLMRSVADTLTAVGTTRDDALALTADYNVVTVGAIATGVKLPAAVAGMDITVRSSVANTIHIYSAVAETLNGTAGSTGLNLDASLGTRCVAMSTSVWICNKIGVIED